jgi:hypothetical protein
MPEPELCLLFLRPLNRLGTHYIISGSVAAILYGEPRLTHDVDLVVFLRREDVAKLREVFPFPEFYLPPAETIQVEIARAQRGHFNAIHADTGFKADFYLAGREELHAWAFRHARRVEYRGEPLLVAPPEYVIVRKLEYFREGGSEKHLRDIRAMLKVSHGQIDRAALEDWVGRQGVTAQWKLAGQT